MPQKLGPIRAVRRTGQEVFLSGGKGREVRLADFWAWSCSDLVSNATRGRLAEFIVAMALDCGPLEELRDEWSAWDLTLNDGTRIEVKTSGMIQSWEQTQVTTPVFNIPKTRAWSKELGRYASNLRGTGELTRHADIYVFAFHAHDDQETVNPIDLDQWRFWVVATKKLNAEMGTKMMLTFSKLKKIAGKEGLRFGDLTADLVRQKLAE